MKPFLQIFGPFVGCVLLAGLLSWAGFDAAAIGAAALGALYLAGVSLYVWGRDDT